MSCEDRLRLGKGYEKLRFSFPFRSPCTIFVPQMQIILNPKYEHLRPFVENLDEHFATGRSLRESRNSIRVCTFEGLELNVKRYHRPRGLQALVYSFLRKPKGLRAYLHAALIREAGMETPEEVAYVERRRGGIIDETFFICLQSPYKRRFYEFAEAEMTAETRSIIEQFARETARLHEAGIVHLDFSPGNILFDKCDDGRWHFSLVDTNRLRRGPVDIVSGCANFARLWGQIPFFDVIADAYAEARGFDAARCRQYVHAARKRFWTRYVRRHGEPFPINFKEDDKS